MLTMHGAIYLRLRSEGGIYASAARAARISGIVWLAAFALAFSFINVMWLEVSYAFGELDETTTVNRFRERSHDT